MSKAGKKRKKEETGFVLDDTRATKTGFLAWQARIDRARARGVRPEDYNDEEQKRLDAEAGIGDAGSS